MRLCLFWHTFAFLYNGGFMAEDKAIETVARTITPRNRAFLEFLANGHPVLEAHKLAGYSGSPRSAYELRRQLRVQLKETLQDHGWSLETLAAEILKLRSIPLDARTLNAGVSLKDKVAYLKLMLQALTAGQEHKARAPSITALIVNKTDKGTQVRFAAPVDTTAQPNVAPEGEGQ